MKNAADRLNDTKLYLSNHISPTQYNEVTTLIAGVADKTALGNALSIGNFNLFNSGPRRAKRALMLLARLFIADPGQRGTEMARLKALPEQSETPLIAEIKSWFTLPGIAGSMVALHAQNNILKMPKWNNINFEAKDAVRGVYHANKSFNCYNACVFWAFQAGAISKRYLWNRLQGKDGNQFFPIYSQVGWDTIIDHSTNFDAFNNGEIIVPAGYTVYFETPYKVFGHVACSLGDGRVISQNSVNIGTTGLNGLHGPLKVEFEKMANAITHIVSIREMIRNYFNPANGYPKVKVTKSNFYDLVGPGDR
ncbi:hypothetical protein ACOSOMT5_P0990 [Acidiphilium sp. MT5]